LEWATVLADGGRSVLFDTEGGSGEWYCDEFTYDVVRWDPPYHPGELTEALDEAARSGYAVVIVDSLSHFWEGEGGTLDVVDAAAARAHGNSFAGWKVGTPAYRHLIDTIQRLDAHLIATMRSKTEWVVETNARGKSEPRRVGTAPVMRAGIEYEFTLVGDLDLEHRLVVSKSRCSALADSVVQAGRAADAAHEFLTWLRKGIEVAPAAVQDEIVEAFASLTDPAERHERKAAFVAAFDRPDRLPASQVDEARAWLAENVTPAAQPAEVEPPPGEIVAGADGHGVQGDPAPALSEAHETPVAPVMFAGGVEVSDTTARVPSASPAFATDAQVRKLNIAMREAGITGDDRLAWVGERIGRPVASSKELTKTEASRLIDLLETET
jgi:hypothetical protein